MNILKEASSVVDFASHCPILYKAVSDNDKPTPGYIVEEVIKITFLSKHHRNHLTEFLFARLFNSSWSGRQKIIKLLIQLAQKGHYDFRNFIRKRDGDLRKVMSVGGQPDPILGNTPQLFFNSSVQELLAYIFDPDIMKVDEDLMHKEDQVTEKGLVATGYGSEGGGGKYYGFGSSPIQKSGTVVDQVRDMVASMTFTESKKENFDSLLESDKGTFQPLSVSLCLPFNETALSTHSQSNLSSSSFSTKATGHIAGKVGGGWCSDEDEGDISKEETGHHNLISTEFETSKIYTQNIDNRMDSSNDSARNSSEDPIISSDSDIFYNLLNQYDSWPVDIVSFNDSCRDIVSKNSPCKIIKDVTSKISHLVEEMIEEEAHELESLSNVNDNIQNEEVTIDSDNFSNSYQASKANESDLSCVCSTKILILLLFMEFAIFGDFITVRDTIKYNLDLELFKSIYEIKRIAKIVRFKAKKMYLVLKSFHCND